MSWFFQVLCYTDQSFFVDITKFEGDRNGLKFGLLFIDFKSRFDFMYIHTCSYNLAQK